jgi:hypothetical protein
MNNIYDDISNLYTKSSFSDRYAGDIWITIILCVLVFLVFNYYIIINNTQPIVDDWANQRCNPSVIPFAGMINAPEGTSSFEYTGANFEYCIQNILSDIIQYALAPIQYILGIQTTVMNDLSSSILAVRGLFDTMRDSIEEQGSDLFNRSLNITLPILYMIRKMEAIMGKTQGAIVSGIYTLYGGFLTMESGFLFIYEVSVNLLWIIFAFIMVCFAVGWLFPPTLAAGFAAATFLALLLIPIVIFVVIMNSINDVFASSNPSTPPYIPGYCFLGDTPIHTKQRGFIPMKDLELGEVLYDDNVVTSIMKSTSKGTVFYKIHNVIVSGGHPVLEENRGWVIASCHTESCRIDEIEDPYIYCIGTQNKTIRIQDLLFTDWDEIDDEDMHALKHHPDLEHYLPATFRRSDVHTYLDGGVDPNTCIRLSTGVIVCMHELNVGDILWYGETVESIIRVKTDDIYAFYDISYKGEPVVSATKNIDIVLLDSYPDALTWTKIEAPPECIHIITNKNGFQMKHVFIGDYNRGIDRYMTDEILNKAYRKL